MSDELIFDPLEKAWRRLQVAVIQAENERIEKMIIASESSKVPPHLAQFRAIKDGTYLKISAWSEARDFCEQIDITSLYGPPGETVDGIHQVTGVFWSDEPLQLHEVISIRTPIVNQQGQHFIASIPNAVIVVVPSDRDLKFIWRSNGVYILSELDPIMDGNPDAAEPLGVLNADDADESFEARAN